MQHQNEEKDPKHGHPENGDNNGNHYGHEKEKGDRGNQYGRDRIPSTSHALPK